MLVKELITALMLGLIGGVIPGPVLTAIFAEILQSGLRKAFNIIFIAFLIESLVAVISLLIFSSLGLNEAIFRILSFFGAGILLWIASTIWRVKSIDTTQKSVFSISKIVLMILSNGVLWTYWITICIPKAVFVGEYISFGEFLFMGLVQAGWLISTLILAFLFSNFRKLLLKPGIISIAFKIFSLVFIYFAVDMIVKSIQFFTQTPPA